jgi:hypothetical protein
MDQYNKTNSALLEQINRAQQRKTRLMKFNSRFRNNSDDQQNFSFDDSLDKFYVTQIDFESVSYSSKKFDKYISTKNLYLYKSLKELVASLVEVFSLEYSFNEENGLIDFKGYCIIKIYEFEDQLILKIVLNKSLYFFPRYLVSLLKIRELNNDSVGKSYFFCKHYYMFNYIFDIINYIIYGEDGYQESSCFEQLN